MKPQSLLAGLLLALAFLALGCQKDDMVQQVQPTTDPLEFRFTATDFDLYTLNLITGETTQLSYISGCGEFDPSFSHNSRYVAHDAFFDPGHSIYLTDTRTHESHLLPGAENGDNASCSPNGKWIAFVSMTNSTICLLPPEGGTPEFLTQGNEPEWSHNSKMLAFTRGGDIYVLNLKTGAETFVCQGEVPTWSHDGKWIAFIRDQQLHKLPVDHNGAPTGPSVQLTNRPGLVAKPAWSPNGKWITFFSWADNGYDIWRVSAEGGEPENLTNTPGFTEVDPDWSPNGQLIVFCRGPV